MGKKINNSIGNFTGLSQLNVRTSSRMGIWLLSFYFFVTLVASIISMTLVTLLKPGQNFDDQTVQEELLAKEEGEDYLSPPKRTTLDTFFDLIRHHFEFF